MIGFLTMKPFLTVGLLTLSRRLVFIRHAILFFFLLALQIGNALLHPFRRGRAFQKMIEEFLQASRVVLLIDSLAQAVFLAVVAEHVGLFVQAPQREEKLDALIPQLAKLFMGHLTRDKLFSKPRLGPLRRKSQH